MSKHTVCGGNISGLLERFLGLQEKARSRTPQRFPIIVIQDAGLDGFWIHRALVAQGIESHVADPPSIASSRRWRRAKTYNIDGEALVRALLAYNPSTRALRLASFINYKATKKLATWNGQLSHAS